MYKEMKIGELKELLKEKGIEFSEKATKKELIELLSENQSEMHEEKPSLINKIKNAIKTPEVAETKSKDPYAYLFERPYERLDTAEREIVRSRSLEYESLDEGVKVKVVNRLPQGMRIVPIVKGKFAKFIQEKEYVISKADYEMLKDMEIKVKTKETEHLCCGNAKYELVKLFEVISNG